MHLVTKKGKEQIHYLNLKHAKHLGVIKQAILPILRIVILCVIKVVTNIDIEETDLLCVQN